MKAAAAGAAFLTVISSAPAVRFEAEGVRVGDALVQGPVLQLKDAGGASILVSGSVVEPLAAVLEIEAAPGRTLALEPGVRAEKKGDTIVLSTHGRRRLLVGESSVESPATIPVADLGTTPVRVRLQEQDPDKTLESLREAARQAQKAREARPDVRKTVQRRVRPRVRRVFDNDPFVGAEAIDSATVRFLSPISPSGQ